MNPPFHTEQHGIGFKEGNKSLRDQVQEALGEVKADGISMKLAEKHAIEEPVIKD